MTNQNDQNSPTTENGPDLRSKAIYPGQSLLMGKPTLQSRLGSNEGQLLIAGSVQADFPLNKMNCIPLFGDISICSVEARYF